MVFAIAFESSKVLNFYVQFVPVSSTHSVLVEENHTAHVWWKMKTINYAQKHMGSAFRNLKKSYLGQKLSDGTIIGGIG